MNSDIAIGDFDVGYLQGSTVVQMSTPRRAVVTVEKKKKQKNTVLLCDGLSAEHKHSDNDNSDGEYQAKKSHKKHDANTQQVQDTVDQLNTKHGSKFIQMQFRIWA